MQTARCTIQDFCDKIHRSILKDLKHALVWGTSVKHQPQRVGKVMIIIITIIIIIIIITWV